MLRGGSCSGGESTENDGTVEHYAVEKTRRNASNRLKPGLQREQDRETEMKRRVQAPTEPDRWETAVEDEEILGCFQTFGNSALRKFLDLISWIR